MWMEAFSSISLQYILLPVMGKAPPPHKLRPVNESLAVPAMWWKMCLPVPKQEASPDCLTNTSAPLLGMPGPGATNGWMIGGYDKRRTR